MQWKSGINQYAQKENNLALVIRAIHADKDASRVRLCEATGLKQATITKIVNQLILWGLVMETESTEPIESNVGRRPIRLALNSGNVLLMAARINRDYLHVAIYDICLKLYYFREMRINALYGVEASMEQLIGMMKDALSSAPAPVLGIGVAVPGPYDYKNRRITLMSGFPGWEKIDIQREIESRIQLPVIIDHDAKCGALAELWHGEHRFTNNLLYICGDRGVGAGLILNGQIYHGRTGFAGEIGHTSINIFGPLCECGNRGCLELYCSTTALEQEYQKESFDSANALSGASAKEIFGLVRGGDPAARRVYTRVVSYLAFGAVNVINTLNPDVVIFADKMIEGGELFLEVAKATLSKYLLPEVYESLIVDVSTLEGGDPMLLGASVLVFEHLLNQPTASFGNLSEE